MTHLRWVPPRSRGAATYELSTTRTSPGTHQRWVTPPCSWTFLSSLRESDFFDDLVGVRLAPGAGGHGPPGIGSVRSPGGAERIVQRPPAEIRKMEQERSRRESAHRRLRWQRRLRVIMWVLGVLVVVVLLVLSLRLVGGSIY